MGRKRNDDLKTTNSYEKLLVEIELSERMGVGPKTLLNHQREAEQLAGEVNPALRAESENKEQNGARKIKQTKQIQGNE
jgi:hypothetical protein